MPSDETTTEVEHATGCPLCGESFEEMVNLKETRSVKWGFMYMTDKVCFDRGENQDVAYVHGEPI